MNYVQPSILIGNLRVDEPMTTLTDLLVSFVCFYAFYRITHKREKTRLINLLRFYFLSMGIATALGGLVGHGFLYAFDYQGDLPVSPYKLPGWLVSMFSVALIERSSIEYARRLIPASTGQFFAWLNLAELTTFVFLTFLTLDFFFVEAHSAYGLLVVVAGFQGFTYWKTRSKASRYMLIAVGISALSALVFMNEWGLHQWMNHFDISHIIMAVSAWFFYRGAMAIEPYGFHPKPAPGRSYRPTKKAQPASV